MNLAPLYHWFETHRRELPWRDTTNPYYIWLSEVILQQTRVAQGMEYYLRFITRWPDVRSLAAATEDEVLRQWQGLGYYSRARNLYKAAQFVVQNHKQADGTVSFPATYDELRQLPGVGDYTAGAIAAFAYDLPHPALDGNVYRVLARLYDCDIPFDTTAGKKHFHHLAEQLLDKQRPRLFNSAIMELGALHCTPLNPDCPACPLAHVCLAYAHGTVALLPVRKTRPTLRDRWLEYHIFLAPSQAGTQTLIHQRGTDDIWRHLWEFPLTESPDAPSAASEKTARPAPFFPTASPAVASRDYTHILSHQRLHARFFLYRVPVLPDIPDTIAVSLADLDIYALSRLTLRALADFRLMF